jgi:hypothetical protein
VPFCFSLLVKIIFIFPWHVDCRKSKDNKDPATWVHKLKLLRPSIKIRKTGDLTANNGIMKEDEELSSIPRGAVAPPSSRGIT